MKEVSAWVLLYQTYLTPVSTKDDADLKSFQLSHHIEDKKATLICKYETRGEKGDLYRQLTH